VADLETAIQRATGAEGGTVVRFLCDGSMLAFGSVSTAAK